MNYLFTHISPEDVGININDRFIFKHIPEYYFILMKHTLEVDDNATIYMVCNPNNISENSKTIIDECHINIIDYKRYYNELFFDSITKLSLDKYLGKVTMYRFPIAYFVMRDYSLNELMYLEADVPIYMKFSEVKKYFNSDYITMCGKAEDYNLLSGIFYTRNINSLYDFCYFIILVLKQHININDMSVAGLYYRLTHKINVLPSIPFETDEYLFDPNSWGQYLGGDNHKKQVGFIDPRHRITREFFIPYNGKFRIYKDTDNIYKLNFNNKIYKFYNLHIHNKDAIKNFI